MRAQEIIDFVLSIAPEPDHAWENVFLFGDGDIEVSGIAVSWWLTLDQVERMAEQGMNLGLSHERVVFEMPSRFVWGILPVYARYLSRWAGCPCCERFILAGSPRLRR